MGSEGWITMPFDQAVQLNPSVELQRGLVYPFVDMRAVNPGSRSVGPSEMREFKGGGSRFMNGDTLMARITPCLENGKIARFAAIEDSPIGHGSTEFIVIRGKPGVTDNGFAYYLTKWDGVHQYCISQMTGSSGRQRVPNNALSQHNVTIPPLKEQQAIACILGALDDKIELNRRMNRTLEAMARAIFKSWFVDFDPVRAKLNGGQPSGLAPHIADLFPDSFEDSDFLKVPKGWEMGSILRIADLLSGGTPKTSVPEYWNGGFPWASAKDVSQCDEAFLIKTEKRISELGLTNSSTKIIPAFSSVVVARGATTGRMAMFGSDIAMNQTCYALTSKDETPFFLYCHFRYFVNALVFSAHGSVFDTITTHTFQTTEMTIPYEKVRKVFEKLVNTTAKH
jgi:type I restriction enzyme S subunit